MNDPLFPELPENLSELSDEALEALLDEHTVALAKIEQEDPDYVGGLTGPEVIVGSRAWRRADQDDQGREAGPRRGRRGLRRTQGRAPRSRP